MVFFPFLSVFFIGGFSCWPWPGGYNCTFSEFYPYFLSARSSFSSCFTDKFKSFAFFIRSHLEKPHQTALKLRIKSPFFSNLSVAEQSPATGKISQIDLSKNH